MAKKTGAQYIQSPTGQKKSSQRRLGSWLAGFATVLALVGTIVTGGVLATTNQTTNQPVASVANAFDVCGVIGANMDGRSSWTANWSIILPDAGGRRFTLSEVVPNSLWWSNFSGTGDSKDFLTDTYDKAAEAVNADRTGNQLPMSANLPAELKDARSLGNCTFTTLVTSIGSMGINLANFVSNITAWIAVSAFDASFICDADIPVGTTPSGCVDLVQIIGGRSNDVTDGGTGVGGNSGILGNLTSGIYKPLVVLVVLVTAMLIFWTGIVKRQFRQALGQLVWLVLSFIIGLAILLNPSMLVKAPMVVSNTMLGCVVGAFNGAGCTGGGAGAGTTGTDTAKDNICISTASVGATDQTALYVNSMGCAIWSAFVLEPYARGAYGVGLSQLDLNSVIDGSTGQTVSELLSGPGWTQGTSTSSADGDVATTNGNPRDICVNLKTSSSYNGMKGGIFTGSTSTTGAGAVCNLAVWDLFMKTQANGGAITTGNLQVDGTWYNVMSRLPANEALWGNYTNANGAFNKWGMGAVAGLVSIVGSALILFTAITALVYYVIAVLMLAFAPVFFLIGLHAGRGKRIMFGWLEQIVSNILKYLVSAIFLLVAITFYGAILGTASDLFVTILFIILITVALIMYRKELIGILGRVDMGGEKMTDMADAAMSRVSGTASNAGRFGKRMGTAAVAGAAAGAITGQGMGQGFGTAAWRELKQGNNVVARTMQAAQSISTDMKNDKGKEQAQIAQQASQMDSDAGRAEEQARRDAAAARPIAESLQEGNGELKQRAETEQDLREKLETKDALVSQSLDKSLEIKWARENPEAAADYAAIRGTEVQADSYSRKAVDARAAGNSELADKYQDISVKSHQRSTDLRAQFEVKYDTPSHSGAEMLGQASDNYQIAERVTIRETSDPTQKSKFEEVAAAGAGFSINETAYKDAIENRKAAESNLGKLQHEWDQTAEELQKSIEHASALRNDAETAKAQSGALKDTIRDFGPGEVVTARKLRNADGEAAAAGAKASKTATVESALQNEVAALQDIAKTSKPTLNADVIVKGEHVTELEANNVDAIARAQKRENDLAIKAAQQKILDERSNAGAVRDVIGGTVASAVLGAPQQAIIRSESRIVEKETEKVVQLQADYDYASQRSNVVEMQRLRVELEETKRSISDHQRNIENANTRLTEVTRNAEATRARGEEKIASAADGRTNVKLSVPETYSTDDRISDHQKAVIAKTVQEAQAIANRPGNDSATQAMLKRLEEKLNTDARSAMTDSELDILAKMVKNTNVSSRLRPDDTAAAKVAEKVEGGVVKATQRLLPSRPGGNPNSAPQEPGPIQPPSPNKPRGPEGR